MKNFLVYFVITGLVEGFLNVERNRNEYQFDIDVDKYFFKGFLNGWRTIPVELLDYFIEKIDKKD